MKGNGVALTAAMLLALAEAPPPWARSSTPRWMKDSDPKPQSDQSRDALLGAAREKRERRRRRNLRRGGEKETI